MKGICFWDNGSREVLLEQARLHGTVPSPYGLHKYSNCIVSILLLTFTITCTSV